jgi:hypothetical protein
VQEDVLVINRSVCARFVESDLRPQAAGEYRTEDGSRETLASRLGFAGNEPLLSFVDNLVIPVLTVQLHNLRAQRTEPAIVQLSKAVAEPRRARALAEAAAWLRTGASTITAGDGRVIVGTPFFVLYLAHVQGVMKFDPQWMQLATGNFLFDAIGQSAGIRGRLFRDFAMRDVVRAFVAANAPKDLYRDAYDRLFTVHNSFPSEALELIAVTRF